MKITLNLVLSMSIIVPCNMIVFYFYISFAALLTAAAYYELLRTRAMMAFFSVPVVAVLEWVIAGGDTFNNFSYTLLNFLTIWVTLTAFLKMADQTISVASFYLNSTLLFYSLSSTIVFFSARFLAGHDLLMTMFGIHAWINFATNLAFGVSIWRLSRSYSLAR